MYKSSGRVATLAVLGLLAARVSSGQTTPSAVLSSPDNLANLTVGQQVTIDVSITGLNVGTDFIFDLDTKVLFPTANFTPVPNPSTISGLTATSGPAGSGTVFLYPSQNPSYDQVAQFDSLSSLASGSATGNFANSSTAPAISENGTYYSFVLKASAIGSGSIQFDPTAGANQYAANDTGFAFAPLPVSGPLAFTVVAGVPESGTFTLALAGLLLVSADLLARRRRHRASIEAQ